jgi:hypothetical protein
LVSVVALNDGIDHVHGAVGQIDDARRHLGEAAARAAVGLENALDVRIHGRLIVGSARPHLEIGLDLSLLHPPVALDGNAVDEGTLSGDGAAVCAVRLLSKSAVRSGKTGHQRAHGDYCGGGRFLPA